MSRKTDMKAGIPKKEESSTVKKTEVAAPATGDQRSALHRDINKIVVDLTKASDIKKTVRTDIVKAVKEMKVQNENDKKTYSALVVYLPFTYNKNYKSLIPKIINDVQQKKKLPTFIVVDRTVIHKKSDFNQKIPRNRTLTSVYDSILEDLISPGIVIGKRMRYHLNGSQHIKVFLNEECRAYIQDKTSIISQIYKKLTNRTVTFEFKHETAFGVIPAMKQGRPQRARKTYAKKENK